MEAARKRLEAYADSLLERAEPSPSALERALTDCAALGLSLGAELARAERELEVLTHAVPERPEVAGDLEAVTRRRDVMLREATALEDLMERLRTRHHAAARNGTTGSRRST